MSELRKGMYVPCTPAGSLLMHLEAKNKQTAINNLLREAAHMPYGSWENFKKRGYTIEFLEN